MRGPDAKRQPLEARARKYFAEPGFKRLLEAVWDRYSRLGRAGGHVVVEETTVEECESINSFMGWDKRAGTDVRVPLAQFEQELLGSAFPYTIAELHELLTGKPLLLRVDRKRQAEQEWQELFRRVDAWFGVAEGTEHPPVVAEWLDGLQQGLAAGHRTLRELWRDSAETAERELGGAVRAWRLLLTGTGMETAVRLPVLAAIATGNPHALDRNAPAGRLLFQALRWSAQAAGGDDEGLAEDGSGLADGMSGIDSLVARELYRRAGILDDDISSSVHVYYPHREMAGGPIIMSLRQVEAAVDLPMITDACVVENPAVFSTLVDISERERMDDSANGNSAGVPLLLCTSGPASAAALRLLDRYLAEGRIGGRIRYSGDFDVKGIEIGNVLAIRYASHFASWRFDSGSYRQGGASIEWGLVFTEEERNRLKHMQAIWDRELCGDMARLGRKLFQEQLIAAMVEDWRSSVAGRKV